ncbi:hypothetical protein GX586_04495 [bacterium]|nr:hypothetical protein [bacterium]
MNSKDRKNPFVYSGRNTSQISFPLGGIGSGSIGLAGNGRLVDWEIFNKPDKGSANHCSHFAIKLEDAKRVIGARILNSDLQPPYTGSPARSDYSGFGFGPGRDTLGGMPHFPGGTFRGEFPFARIAFKDPAFPCAVRMTAFNPFIPLNDKDSSIPAAFFEFEVANTRRAAVTCTIAAVLGNPLPAPNVHSLSHEDGVTAMRVGTAGLGADDVTRGELAVATDNPGVSAQQFWFRGRWFDSLEVYWRDFTSFGPLNNRTYEPEKAGNGNHAVLAARLAIPARTTGRIRFVISWHFPTCENYWHANARENALKAGVPPTWKNYYATIWPDAAASARYALKHWPRLFAETKRFKDALFSSTLPAAAIDAISANISILKSPTVLRLEDGTFYGFEGCHGKAGCCPGSCTHVWNYAQALPFLFPNLERSMRAADYKYNLRPDGGMPFRLSLPLGTDRSGFRPCADGQFGDVLKTYRDWKICGDSAWLGALWPSVKKSIEFAWAPTNDDKWDPEKTGVLHGRQHHTLDMELFGPNAWLTGMYLGALKAGAEMAGAVGDDGAAREFRALFLKGKTWTYKNLFNGRYYCQRVNLNDKSILEQFDEGGQSLGGGSASDAYWDEEHGEIKYQIAEGSGIDPVLAQWHADLYGLGEIFDPKQTNKALRSLFAINFKQRMRDFYNPCRIFCLNDEGGMVICDWPKGARKPVIPAPYTQETMHGFEYAAASHMIMRGLVSEGMKAVTAVRMRYDGERRNPWNEFECGSNYARSMASYALLNAFSGFEFDMTRGMIGFNPISAKGKAFTCFWSLEGAWGIVKTTARSCELRVLHGALKVKEFRVPAGMKARRVTCGGRAIAFTADGRAVRMDGVEVAPEAALVVRM